MTSPISDILHKTFLYGHGVGSADDIAPEDKEQAFINTRKYALTEAEQAIQNIIAEAIGPNVDIEQYPKESEERWAAITANAVRLTIRAKLGIPTEPHQ